MNQEMARAYGIISFGSKLSSYGKPTVGLRSTIIRGTISYVFVRLWLIVQKLIIDNGTP